MTVPLRPLRVAAFALGWAVLAGASLFVRDPASRTFLCTAALAPIAWALRVRAAPPPAAKPEPPTVAEILARAAAGAPGATAARSVLGSPLGARSGAQVSTRRYLRLRRLTEQFLREVRRMNLVAVWGREGSIPRRQAMSEIREIEMRMQKLVARMKAVAGREEPTAA
jgi:hypothetical protein